jgi:ribonuclease E
MTEHALSEEMPAPKTRRTRRAATKKKTDDPRPPAAPSAPEPISADSAHTDEAQAPKAKSRRSRRGGRGRSKRAASADQGAGGLAPTRPEGDTGGAAPHPEEDAGQPAPQPDAVAPKARKESAKEKDSPKAAKQKMFISIVSGEQVEVVLTEQGGVCEYYLEMFHQAKIKGNIYRGVIHNIDNNLQAAFVNYGGAKNGFLQIDEVHPEYWLHHHEESRGKKYPPIQKALKIGQEVLVQVVKEPAGTKGAFLTTWISLAGRFLVLTPGQEQIGVSRKVEEEEERARLRELMNGIEPGEGLGVIVRTVSAGTNKSTLQKDLQYLKRLWKEIRAKAGKESAPALVYQEPGLARRAVRDYLTDDINEVWVDDESAANDARETINLLFPRKANLVRLHQDPRQSLWERFDIQRQLEQIYSREITLPSGGRLVFDQTEALMAVDINSGKIHGKGNFEAMALKTNLEAAETIARQLRLRDIGGQVVVDFIEMRDKNHIRDVEKVLRQAMKNDRARHDIGRISPFGLLELVRQRTGSSALAITTELCPCCNGSGLRRNMEWQALQTLRGFSRQMRGMNPGSLCGFELPLELGLYLLNEKRERLRELEQLHGMHIEIRLLRV